MHKKMRLLALALLTLSTQNLVAHTNKTFFSVRPQSVDSLLERVTLQSMNASKAEDSFGGIFQITGSYTEAIQTNGLTRYFLSNNQSTMSKTRDQLRVMIPDSANAGADGLPLPSDNATNILLSPTLRTYCLMMTYYQDLEKILPGLYFNVRLPIVEAETDLGYITIGGNNATVKEFVSGTLNEIPATAANARQPLQYAKTDGKQQMVGIADIDLRMGYAFLQKPHGSLGINLGLTVPTGNSPEATYAFEAIYGNNGHWGFGAGIEGHYILWEGEASHLKMHASTDYRNLFANTERRTFGIKGIAQGQYRIVALNQIAAPPQEAIPAANVLSLSTDVTPGFLLDNVVGLTYTYGGFTVDLGYNLWYRDAESLQLRDTWTDTKYVYITDDPAAVAAAHPVTFGTPNQTDFTAGSTAYAALTEETIDFDAGRTPSQLTHKALLGVGYIFKEFEYPIMLGLGGHYELPDTNSAAQTWGFYLKTGIAF